MSIQHAEFSPSTLKNREICPGWTPDRTSDKTKADEGTMLHHAVETEKVPDTFTEEQKELAAACLKYAAPYLKAAKEVHRELKLHVMDDMTFGFADLVVLRGKAHADVIDWKFGRWEVEDASINRQGYSYCLGVFEKFPQVQSVTVHFVMPRLKEVTTHTFFRNDVGGLKKCLRGIITRCQLYRDTKDESMLNPTEFGCMFCGRGDCPKMIKFQLDHAKKYAPLELADEVHSSQITDPRKALQLFTAAKVLETMISSTKKHLLNWAMEQGGSINDENGKPLLEVKSKSGSRSITNPVLAWDIIAKHLAPEEIQSACKISLADVLKLVHDKSSKGSKGKVVGQLERELFDAGVVSQGDPTQYLGKARE